METAESMYLKDCDCMCIASRFHASNNHQMSGSDSASVHQTTHYLELFRKFQFPFRLRGDLNFIPENSGLEIFKNQFFGLAGIPSVIEAIAGTHIGDRGYQLLHREETKQKYSIEVEKECFP